MMEKDLGGRYASTTESRTRRDSDGYLFYLVFLEHNNTLQSFSRKQYFLFLDTICIPMSWV